MGAQVFLSHSADDQKIAYEVCAGLESRGIRCWIAPRDVQPGVAMLKTGDHVTISASGSWCLGVSVETGVPIFGSPAGIRPARADEPLLLPNGTLGQLIGRVGEGSWFAIGAAFDWTSTSDGQLWLAFNERGDNPAWWADNSGSVTLELRIG